MAKEVAVFVGTQGETLPLQEEGRIVVYQRSQGKWSKHREKYFSLGTGKSLKELRQKMAELIIFLGNCRTFVGLSVTGVPFYELEKAGCSVWKFAGRPLEFLDIVLRQEETNKEKEMPENNSLLTPKEISKGYFSISLKELQETNAGLTSKQVLIPFLRQVPFVELEVTCSHLPPWLETEFLKGSLSGDIKRISSNELKVIITRKCCS